jgi:hypothetical protein
MTRPSAFRILLLVLVSPFAPPTGARADVAPMPVPFTGSCYCHAVCAGASGRYRVDFKVGSRATVRDDETTAAREQCQQAAKGSKFPSDLTEGTTTPEELLKLYYVGGGKVAPASPAGCAEIQCGAKQYER